MIAQRRAVEIANNHLDTKRLGACHHQLDRLRVARVGDEKLRRVLELTYSQPGLKQEVVADRLSLSFGTYRRHLSTARERLARWLWEKVRP